MIIRNGDENLDSLLYQVFKKCQNLPIKPEIRVLGDRIEIKLEKEDSAMTLTVEKLKDYKVNYREWHDGWKNISNPWICEECLKTEKNILFIKNYSDVEYFCIHNNFIEDEIIIFLNS